MERGSDNPTLRTMLRIASALDADIHVIERDGAENRTVLSNEAFDRFVNQLDEASSALEGLAELIRRPRRVQLPE